MRGTAAGNAASQSAVHSGRCSCSSGSGSDSDSKRMPRRGHLHARPSLVVAATGSQVGATVAECDMSEGGGHISRDRETLLTAPAGRRLSNGDGCV